MVSAFQLFQAYCFPVIENRPNFQYFLPNQTYIQSNYHVYVYVNGDGYVRGVRQAYSQLVNPSNLMKTLSSLDQPFSNNTEQLIDVETVFSVL